METLGFMSIDGLSTGGSETQSARPQKSKLTFSRRYIDNNLFSMYHHSNTERATFSTEHGRNVTSAIGDARKSLGLGERYGCAPHDFWVSRRPYPHEESIFTWLDTQVLPQSIKVSEAGKKALVIMNTGGIRFDIFQGPFTKDTKFLVSPFTSGIRYIKDVPYKTARQVLKLLNNEGPILEAMREGNTYLQPPEHVAAQYRAHFYTPTSRQEVFDLNPQKQSPISMGGEDGLFPGYTTYDDAGHDGDDTLHSEIPFYEVPNCVQASVGFDYKNDEETEVVDLMYNEFIQKWILLGLEYLGVKYGSEDTHSYAEARSFTDIMTDWVRDHWDVEGDHCP